MRTLAHLSDLHFGRTDAAVVRGLLHDLERVGVDLVVVSGDLTQRARSSQFAEARAFLDALPAPYLVVPGNHDLTPVYRPLGRFVDPFRLYREYIGDELEPAYNDEEIAVVGVNTAHPRRISEGLISTRQLGELQGRLCRYGAQQFKVLVTHHPFIPHPDARRSPIVGRADRALGALESCGVDLLLAGHLHHAFTGDLLDHHATVTRSILVAQASTSTSTRTRHHCNGYNFIRIQPARVELEVRGWSGAAFEGLRAEAFTRREHRWVAD